MATYDSTLLFPPQFIEGFPGNPFARRPLLRRVAEANSRLKQIEADLSKWQKQPIPFIVDDILIKFDNERATATLQVLAELSSKTQVIFFTHHRHLVEMAKTNIKPGILFEHTLTP